MADNHKMNAVLRLREDTLANYEKVQDTFIPKNGEVCLVITTNGIKAKIGDGSHTYRGLGWADLGIFSIGYYYNGKFYKESSHTTEMDTFSLLYMDLHSFKLYYYDGTAYVLVNDVKPASSTEAGILKLYSAWNGTNEDGSVTQKAIKDKFDEI